MATQWRSLRQVLKTTEHLVFGEAPKLIKQLQNPQTMQRNIQQGLQKGLAQGIRIGIDALAANAAEQRAAQNRAAIPAGRPVTSTAVPTAQRARRIAYSPDLDGRADPGEIVWTWVVFEDDPSRGKDRPVLVVGRDRQTLLGLMLSSQAHHAGHPDWIGIGTGPWDHEGRPSWVRLDRVLVVPEEGIRREGAIVERTTFDLVATRLRADFSWR